MPKAEDIAGNGQLNLTRLEVEILSHALNSTRLGNYNASQKERLPTLARKLAGYLAESNPYKYERKTEPKPPKKLVGFALTRGEPGSKGHKVSPFEIAVANSPLE